MGGGAVIGDWTAVAVRARGLAARRLGRAGAQQLARSGSLDEAVRFLSRTPPYGRDVQAGMDLASAEYALSSTLLWHLRVLAGWAPSRGLDRVRLLAAGFEIANVVGLLARLEGRGAAPPYALGALATRWGTISRAASAEDVRRALAASAWGDPGASDLSSVRAAMQAAWARRVAFGVPEAQGWAKIFAGLLAARMVVAGQASRSDDIARNLRLVVGSKWQTVESFEALASSLPISAAEALADVREAGDLWRAEARSWSLIEAQALRMQAGWRPAPSAVVAVTGLLAADAWRTRAALEVAAHGGRAPLEVFDVVA
jgi:hypothetical protein